MRVYYKQLALLFFDDLFFFGLSQLPRTWYIPRRRVRSSVGFFTIYRSSHDREEQVDYGPPTVGNGDDCWNVLLTYPEKSYRFFFRVIIHVPFRKRESALSSMSTVSSN